MAGVMVREEPLIKQLVRSRALGRRDHSSSPTRGRSPVQKFLIQSKLNKNMKSAYVQPIRSISQPPPSNQQRLHNNVQLDSSPKIANTYLHTPIDARSVSSFQLHCFPMNSTDRMSFQSRNLTTIPFDASIISNSQSISQPNLVANISPNIFDGVHHTYCSPINLSSRCSSISTLPPSSSRCGSPIQPTLLSPLNLSTSSTPLGSRHNLSVLPKFLPIHSQEPRSTLCQQPISDMDITVHKNKSCNSIYSAPEDVFHIEKNVGACDESRPAVLDSDTCRNKLDHQPIHSEEHFSPISVPTRRGISHDTSLHNIEAPFPRRGSLLPIFEHLHFNDEICFSGPSTVPLHLENMNMSNSKRSDTCSPKGSNMSQFATQAEKDKTGIFHHPADYASNEQLLMESTEIKNFPESSNFNLNLGPDAESNWPCNNTVHVTPEELQPINDNGITQYICRDAWRSALEAERDYAYSNKKYNISDGIPKDDPIQSFHTDLSKEDIHRPNKIRHNVSTGIHEIESKSPMHPVMSTVRKQYTNKSFVAEANTAKNVKEVHDLNNNGNNCKCQMSSESTCPPSYRNFEKISPFLNPCAVPACQCLSSLYCKICNLLGPYNGSGVQKISLFTISTNLKDESGSAFDVSNGDITASSTSFDSCSAYCTGTDEYSSIPKDIEPSQALANDLINNYSHYEKEVCLHEPKKRKWRVDKKRR